MALTRPLPGGPVQIPDGPIDVLHGDDADSIRRLGAWAMNSSTQSLYTWQHACTTSVSGLRMTFINRVGLSTSASIPACCWNCTRISGS